MVMVELRSECKTSLSNISKSIDVDRRFPHNVFFGEWIYFFFDSDWMFDSAFVDHVKALLYIEGATCACLANLDALVESDDSDRRFFIDYNTTSDAYQILLGGEKPGQGWIYDLDRFGCSSDLSQWSIYCERSSEIAVIAVRPSYPVDHYKKFLSLLNATELTEAIREPISYGFSEEALSVEWRDILLQEYCSSSKD